jgi:hypothetical protein
VVSGKGIGLRLPGIGFSVQETGVESAFSWEGSDSVYLRVQELAVGRRTATENLKR